MANIAGGKNRKHGRKKISCAQYRAEGRREKSKALKLLKHLSAKWGAGDELAQAAYDALPELAKKRAQKIVQKLSGYNQPSEQSQ